MKSQIIPKDIEECFGYLEDNLTPKQLLFIKESEDNLIKLHRSLGLWIRNNWGLWGDSVLKSYLEGIGLFHADDMSSTILYCFHRHLNGLSIDIESQVKKYEKYWKDLKGVI